MFEGVNKFFRSMFGGKDDTSEDVLLESLNAPDDEYIHADIGLIMKSTITGLSAYSGLKYKESLVPEKPRTNGEGLGATEYGYWKNILDAIVVEVHKASRARPHTKTAYQSLSLTVPEKELSFAKNLGTTRELIAKKILRDVRPPATS